MHCPLAELAYFRNFWYTTRYINPPKGSIAYLISKMSAFTDSQYVSTTGAVAAVKRRTSDSFPESTPKRVVTESRTRLPSIASQPIQPCPVCHRPCWFCQTSSAFQAEDEALPVEVDFQQAMPLREPSTAAASEAFRSSEYCTSAQCSTITSGKRKQPDADGRVYLGPKHPGFEENILQASKVQVGFILKKNATPDTIFGNQPTIPSSDALLHLGDTEFDRIAQDLAVYETGGDDENALGVIYTKNLLIQEPLQSPQGPVKTMSSRKDHWRPHKSGPTIESTVYYFDWDIEPDVTYAVSINQFDLHIRNRLTKAPLDSWLADKRGSCPYLTIEYKCGAKTGKRLHAMYQNVTASVIWLYQRRAMRQKLDLDTVNLRHYSIILMDGNYEIWEGRCSEDGFLVQIQAMGNLKLIRDLKEFVEWINAIHTWGLTTNAESYKKDVLELLRRLDEGPPITPASLERNPQPADASPAFTTPAETDPATTARQEASSLP